MMDGRLSSSAAQSLVAGIAAPRRWRAPMRSHYGDNESRRTQ
jgi:hypothetical protein